jgi:hypothetical protein
VIVVGVVLFLAISGIVARFFSAENVERDHELILLQAQVKGDVPGMLAQLPGCAARPACVATVRGNATRLRRPGTVLILSTQSTTNHSLSSSTGVTRIAWKAGARFPVVQCIKVHRSGNFLTGIGVALVSVSAPIEESADC